MIIKIRRVYLLPSVLVVLCLFVGCTKRERTFAGIVIGAGVGALIGSVAGNTGGAVAGTFLGGALGGVIGNASGKNVDSSRDHSDRREYWRE